MPSRGPGQPFMPLGVKQEMFEQAGNTQGPTHLRIEGGNLVGSTNIDKQKVQKKKKKKVKVTPKRPGQAALDKKHRQAWAAEMARRKVEGPDFEKPIPAQPKKEPIVTGFHAGLDPSMSVASQALVSSAFAGNYTEIKGITQGGGTGRVLDANIKDMSFTEQGGGGFAWRTEKVYGVTDNERAGNQRKVRITLEGGYKGINTNNKYLDVVYGYNANTGRVAWHITPPAGTFIGPTAVAGGQAPSASGATPAASDWLEIDDDDDGDVDLPSDNEDDDAWDVPVKPEGGPEYPFYNQPTIGNGQPVIPLGYSELMAVQGQLDTANAQLASYQGRDGEVANLQQTITQYQQAIEAQKKALEAGRQEEVNALQQTLTQYQRAFDQQKNQLDGQHNQEIAAMQQTITQYQKALSDAQAKGGVEVQGMQQVITQWQGAVQRMQDEQQRLNYLNSEEQQRLKRVAAEEMGAVQRELNEQKAALERAKQEGQVSQAEAATLAQNLARQQALVADYEQGRQSGNADLASLNKQNEGLAAELAKQKAALANWDAAFDKGNAEIEALKKQVEQGGAEAQTAKALLEESRKRERDAAFAKEQLERQLQTAEQLHQQAVAQAVQQAVAARNAEINAAQGIVPGADALDEKIATILRQTKQASDEQLAALMAQVSKQGATGGGGDGPGGGTTSVAVGFAIVLTLYLYWHYRKKRR